MKESFKGSLLAWGWVWEWVVLGSRGEKRKMENRDQSAEFHYLVANRTNKSQMKQEASSRETEGSACYCALIHHCQLNLLCPVAAINLLLHSSIPEPTDTTQNSLRWTAFTKQTHSLFWAPALKETPKPARREGLPILGGSHALLLDFNLFISQKATLIGPIVWGEFFHTL